MINYVLKSKIVEFDSNSPVISRFFHIGITVSSLENAITFFTEGLDCTLISRRELKGEYLGKVLGNPSIRKANIALLEFKSGPVLELVEYDSVLSSEYVEIQHNGVHHLAHFVTDIEETINRLLSLGCRLLGNREVKIPSGPYLDCRIAFLKGPFNLTIEVIEKTDL
jgi:lactoylglutathione lyase